MSKMDRRKFLKTGAAGVAGLTVAGSGVINLGCTVPSKADIDMVTLGNTGITTSRLAFGTGTVGYNKGSNQTRLGMETFVKMARHAYDRGVRFYEMADGYGSHPFVGEAIKTMPREKLTLSSKVWANKDGSDNLEPVDKIIDRFRQEIGTDYIDILMLHCMTDGNWPENRKHFIDGFSKAKQDGIIKKVGVSCHSWDALVAAVNNPWIDIVQARINPFQTAMDGTPEDISGLLAKAQAAGKGVIGMKIFGEGKNVKDEEREQSIHFALTKGNIHCMTIGMESIEQIDDAIERIMRLAKQ